MNISRIFQEIANRFSSHYLMNDGANRITYIVALRRASSVSYFLCENGCVPGSKVLVISNGRREYLEVLLGCAQAGIQFLPSSVRDDKETIFSTIRETKPQILFLEPQIAKMLGPELKSLFPSSRVVVFGSTSDFTQYSRLTRKHCSFFSAGIPADTPVIGILSEGRIVQSLSYGQLHAFLSRHMKKVSTGGCCMLCIPYLHITYALEIFCSFSQGTQIIMPSHVTPKAILQNASKHRITEIMMTPSLLRTVARDARFFGGDLQSVHTLRLGLCNIGPETVRNIQALFSPSCKVCKMMHYNARYSLLNLTVAELDPAANFLQAPINSVGKAIQGTEIRAMDRYGNLLPAGEMGSLVFRRSPEEEWTAIGEIGHIDSEGYIFLDCRNLPPHVEKPEKIFHVLAGLDRPAKTLSDNYSFPLTRFDEMMDDFSSAENEKDPRSLCRRLSSSILHNIDIPLKFISIVFPLKMVNMKLNTADVMNELDSSSLFHKLPDRFFIPTETDVREVDVNDADFPAGCTLLYYPLHSVDGLLVGEVYFGIQEDASSLSSYKSMQIHICLRFLTSCLSSVERRLRSDTMLSLILKSFDMISDGVGISDIGETPALLYTNNRSKQLIQLGKVNPTFGRLLEENQTQNMYNLRYKNEDESSSSFFYKEPNGRNIWVNYVARKVRSGDDEYAVCISHTQQENHSVTHLRGLLSKKEIAVLELIAAGMTNKEAAEKLNVSINTIKFHLSKIYEKLGVRNRSELLSSTFRP